MTVSTQRLLDMLPPHALESEMALLGSVLLDPKILDEMQVELPGPDIFYSDAHAAIYRALVKCYDKAHCGLDITLVCEMLKDHDQINEAGGSDYIVDLGRGVVSAVLWKGHAKVVVERFKTRRAIGALGDALHAITRPGADFDTVMPGLCDQLSDLTANAGAEQVFRSGDVARLLAERIRTGEKPPVIPSGFQTLDKMLKGGGFRRGQSVGIGGRPSNGKSMFGANLAVNVSEQGFKTAFISLEMDPEEIVERWMAFYGFSETDARCKAVELELAVEIMENHDIPIIDVPNSELGNIRSHIRSIKRKRGLDLVVIDYLQLIRVAGIEREYEYVTHASKAMKSIAREYGIVNAVAFQLNREGGKKERPGMADGKGSGAIEQDFDTMMLIHNPPDAKPGTMAELILAKQRRGQTGTILMECNKTQSRFTDKGEKKWDEQTTEDYTDLPI